MKRPNLLKNITNRAEKKKPSTKKAECAQESIETNTCHDKSVNILMYSEYAESSVLYMKRIEKQLLPNASYMVFQEELQWSMRSILVDWLIEVHWKLGLVQETLFFTINTIDRFLSLRTVSSDKLQLVGITALFISSKYEEVECPSIETFAMISRDTLTEEDIRKAEKYILYVLQCLIEFPSPVTFLSLCSQEDRRDHRVWRTAQYILERMYLDETFLKYPGSLKACCSVYLAKKVCRKRKFLETVPLLVGYSFEDLKGCLIELNEILSIPNIHKNVVLKYRGSRGDYDVLGAVDAFFRKESG